MKCVCVCVRGGGEREREIWILFISIAVVKYPVKSNLREKGFALAHNSRLQHIIAGKAQPQELERTGHNASRMIKSSKP